MSLQSIQYHLDVAKPLFIRVMRDEIQPKAGRWIQYQGYEIIGDTVYFRFKSSQNSLSFLVYGGLMNPNLEGDISFLYSEIYEYFKALKQPYIQY